MPSGDGTSGSPEPLEGQLQGCPCTDPQAGFWTGLLRPALYPSADQSRCWGSWRLAGVRALKLGRGSE